MATISGTGVADDLQGTELDDEINALAGDDTVYGGGGNDRIFGGLDDDTLDGGAGDDNISGGPGNDSLNGGPGNDQVYADTGDDIVTYVIGEGADFISGERGIDTLRLEVTSEELPAVRDEILQYAAWLENQVASFGGEASHANLIASSTYTFSFGLRVTTVERLEVIVDGEPRGLDQLTNSAPVVEPVQALAGTEDEPIAGSIGATDPDGDNLNYELTQGPQNGELAFDATTGEFTYSPFADSSGADSFSVLVSDGQGGTAEQRVDISVAGAADAPTLSVSVPDTGPASNVIMGTDGNDYIRANRMSSEANLTYALEIDAGLTDTDGSEQLSLVVAGMPESASLSAGVQQDDGSWLLAADQLAGLSVTLAAPGEVTLDISAISTESNGDTAVTSQPVSFGSAATGDDNFIDAGAGDDMVRAGRGDDVVIGGQGNDWLFGGRGNDTLDFSTSESSTWVNLRAHRAWGEDSGRDFLRGFENVTGSEFDDRIAGNNRANEISGGAGDDIIAGGRGADILSGGEGADSFAYHRTDVMTGRHHRGVDTVTDFDEFDTLDFSRLLRGNQKRSLEDYVTATETEDGTMISVDMGGRRGTVDVAFLEGVTDFNLDQISVERGGHGARGNAFGHRGSHNEPESHDHGHHDAGGELFS